MCVRVEGEAVRLRLIRRLKVRINDKRKARGGCLVLNRDGGRRGEENVS